MRLHQCQISISEITALALSPIVTGWAQQAVAFHIIYLAREKQCCVLCNQNIASVPAGFQLKMSTTEDSVHV